MFNSFAFAQSPSDKRISFDFQAASGSPISFTISNNVYSVGRRIRTEFGEGHSYGDNSPFIALESLTSTTMNIIFDRDDMMQEINWIVTGDTDSIIGHLDLSTQTRLRNNIFIAGHHLLTGITFAPIIATDDYVNNETTLILRENDLRALDLSSLTGTTGSLQIYNNLSLSSLILPTTQLTASVSMRNSLLTSVDFSTMTALNGVSTGPNPLMTAVTFPNLIATATGTWDLTNTPIHHVDFSPMRTNFGGKIKLFHASTTGVTFPSCNNTITELSMNNCGFASDYTIDCRSLTGISGSITCRNQNHGGILFGPSDNSISLYYGRSQQQLKELDLSMLTDINTSFWLYTCNSLTGVTYGNWSNAFTTFYSYNLPLVTELNMTGITGMGGLIVFRENTACENIYLPETTRTITQLQCYSCPVLEYLDMKPLSGGSNNSIILKFDDNTNWTSDISNHILHDIDNFGWTGGVLEMSGTTSGYDTTSGGYNGFTHYTNLTSKGWSITMSGLTS